jgi:hypothetical protein
MAEAISAVRLLQSIALAVSTRPVQRALATQGNRGAPTGFMDFRDVPLTARASEKFVGGVGEFVKTIPGTPGRTRASGLKAGLRDSRGCCGTASPYGAVICFASQIAAAEAETAIKATNASPVK